jgi:predicted RecB family nuclease
MESEYASWMDRLHLELPDSVQPDPDSAEDEILRAKGEEHELAFLEQLIADGRDVVNLKGSFGNIAETLLAMKEGREIIYQGTLASGVLAGIADFLVRVNGDSELGNYHYEPWDTKLARKPKPYFIVQLCCYAEMLAALQGRLPQELQVVLGTQVRRRFRTEDYFYYYCYLKSGFLRLQDKFNPTKAPDIPSSKNLGRWSSHGMTMLQGRDDLSLIAGTRTLQIRRMREAGIETAQELANTSLEKIHGISAPVFRKMRRQTRLQIASRGLPTPQFELIEPDPANPRLGLAALPPESSNDIFFDMEGYPLLEDGLEYLFGVTYIDNAVPVFRDWWAHDHEEERKAFKCFVRWAFDRWSRDPSMHIYHYAAYEVTALRRLMGRYAACEDEIDQLLRNEVFVDLYSVVRQGVLVGEPSYSLKNIEKLYRGQRQSEVASAADSLVFYQRWLDTRDGSDWRSSPTLQVIREYNRDDCESTWQLACWLRAVQRQVGIAYIPKPLVPESENIKEIAEQAKYAEEMRAEIPADRDANPEHWRVHELLSWFLEFHRRESKPIWWARYERHAMTVQELVDDPECLGGLVRTKRPPEKIKRSYGYEYRFSAEQETKLREGSKCIFAHDLTRRATIEAFDSIAGLLTLKFSSQEAPASLGLIPDEWVDPAPIAQSIERLIHRYRESGELPTAIEHFLHRHQPALRSHFPGGPIIPVGMDLVQGSINAAVDMDNSTLCIQGPPGGGKTYTAAHMILALLRIGKRVGITSNSHRAICLLLNETAKLAEVGGYRFRGVKVGGDEEDNKDLHERFESVESASKLFTVAQLPNLIGGTAWAFSHVTAQGTLDYLFVDEAGQVSVANLLGMAPSTRNIILIGDQMQLSQPIKGSHPGESGTSTLEYLLQNHATIPDDLGIFLGETWRMHPEVCQFISGAVYEDRLKPKPLTAGRTIRFRTRPGRYIRQNAGVVFVPTEHEGNTYESEEEAEIIRQIVGELVGQFFTEADKPERPLTRDDILVVTPYNLQVRKLTEHLPGIRVGTVDKFQGQEAVVVIYSMCASSGDASPRGIEFLFSKNRLNVAISRAQTLAIVVGNRSLARTRCTTLGQMQLVNVFCRAVEHSTIIKVAGATELEPATSCVTGRRST